MEVDSTITPPVNNTSNTPKQSTNDSMHAHSNNKGLFEDTAYEQTFPEKIKGKNKQTWSDEMDEND